MNQPLIKLIKKYALKFLIVYCSISTLLFISITISTIAILPTVKTIDLTHVSSHKLNEGLQMSQRVWVGLFLTPIFIAAIILLIEVVTDYFGYRQNNKISGIAKDTKKGK